MRRLALMFAVCTATLLLAGCSSESTTVTMPDVIGKSLDVALSDVERAGFGDEVEVLGGGIFGVLDESNWTVCSQEPDNGTEVSSAPRLTVDRTCDTEDAPEPAQGAEESSSEATVEPTATPTVAPEPVETAPAELTEFAATYFLSKAWEDKFIYGGKVHYLMDLRNAERYDDGTYFLKIGATVKNSSGTEYGATIEGKVGGTDDNPVILESTLYADTGEWTDYFG